MSLNKAQKQAVLLPHNEHALIIAGAGTGKTKTLIARIVELTKYYKTSEIIGLTFTNKAATEMKERLEKEGVEGVFLGTFHSFALKLIKEDLEGFNLKKAKVIDEKEFFTIIKRLCIENNIEIKNGLVETIASFITYNKEKGLRSNNIPYKGIGIKRNLEMYGKYEKYCIENSVLDFGELLIKLKERLELDVEYLAILRDKYKTYLVDEFQDTNPIQYSLLKLLIGEKGSIFAVGDDSQSIYGFRGAVVKNIFDFKDICKTENLVKLEQNYRSTKNIVNLSNDFIKTSKERIEKELWTSNKEGSLINVKKCFNENEEASFVVEQIENLLKYNRGLKFKDIAVIYRGNAQSTKIEQELMLRKIPFKVSGGIGFFEKMEIKTLIACANLLCNINDGEAFSTVVVKLYEDLKLNKKTLENWIIEAEQEKIPFSQLILDRKSYKYPEFKKLFNYLKLGMEEFKYSNMREAFEVFLTNIGFFRWLEEKRKDNVEIFLKQITKYEESGGNSFSNFMFKLNHNMIKENNSVNLMTIHASKGLEFKCVFLIGVEDGVLPSLQSEDVEEERRLFYVGLTRAKEILYLTYAQNRFNGYEFVSYPPSCFLADLPIKYLNFVDKGSNISFNELKNQNAENKEEEVSLSKKFEVEDFYQFIPATENKKEEVKEIVSDFKSGEKVRINGVKSEIISINFNEFNEVLLTVKQKDSKLKTFNVNYCQIKR